MEMKNLIHVLNGFLEVWSEADCGKINDKCGDCPFAHKMYEYEDGETKNLCEVLGEINDEMEAITNKLH